MSPQELEHYILHDKDFETFVTRFESLSAKERSALSKTVRALKRKYSVYNETLAVLPRKVTARMGEAQTRGLIDQKIGLAFYALAPRSTLKGVSAWSLQGSEAFEQVMTDRAKYMPEGWLDSFLEDELSQEFGHMVNFAIMRRWIKAGLCQRPNHPTYYSHFLSAIIDWRDWKDSEANKTHFISASKRILADPDLVDHVLPCFDLNLHLFNYDPLKYSDKAAPNFETFPQAVLKLCKSGDLSRSDVLNKSLSSLWEDLPQSEYAGRYKIHAALEPTITERLACEDSYYGLLSHKVGHVVKFALNQIATLEKEGALSVERFCAEAPQVFYQAPKGNAVTVVKLMKRLLKSYPDKQGVILTGICEALRHENMDVQAQALSLLESITPLADEGKNACREAVDFISPSLRARLLALCGEELKEDDPLTPIDLTTLTQDMDEATCHVLGITDMMADEACLYRPIYADLMAHNILPDLEPIQPIDSLDRLLDNIAHNMEEVQNTTVLYQIIGGICQIKPNYDTEFASKTDPLLKRMGPPHLAFAGFGQGINDAVATWMTGRLEQRLDNYRDGFRFTKPLEKWLKWITLRLSRGERFTPLALPTHEGGWIDPQIWVKRLVGDAVIEPIDFKLSLLRLAPDGRDRVLSAIPALPAPYDRIATFALGSDIEPSLEDKPHYDLWVTAARAHDPRADWRDSFACMGIEDDWPNSVQTARFEWKPEPETDYKVAKLDVSVFPKRIKAETPGDKAPPAQTGGFVGRLKSLFQKTEPVAPAALAPLVTRSNLDSLPTSLLSIDAYKYRYFAWGEATFVNWIIEQWPAMPDAVHMQGAKNITVRLNEDGDSVISGYGFFDGLFPPRQYWHPPAHLVLVLGLLARNADVKAISVDAMIYGIEKGLFEPDQWVTTLLHLQTGGWVKVGRLKDTLTPLVQTSALHAFVVSDILQSWLSQTDLSARNMFAPLEILLEAQSTIRQPLSDNVKTALADLKGSSKAAKLAKTILSLDYDDVDMRAHIKSLAIEGRML